MTWTKCASFPNYEVSYDGRIRNASTLLVLKPCIDVGSGSGKRCPRARVSPVRSGYKQKKVCLAGLVALAFLGDRPQGMVLDHIDRNSLNNRADNLRWVSVSENNRNRSNSKLTADDVGVIRQMILEGFTNKEIANHFSVDPSYISHIKRGRKGKVEVSS